MGLLHMPPSSSSTWTSDLCRILALYVRSAVSIIRKSLRALVASYQLHWRPRMTALTHTQGSQTDSSLGSSDPIRIYRYWSRMPKKIAGIKKPELLNGDIQVD